MADQRLAAPIHGDEGEQAVLDFVPFAGARGQVSHRHRQPCLVGKSLQLTLPEPELHPVAAAAGGGDRQTCGTGIARLPKLVPPAPDALDGKGGGIGINADADPAVVGGNVIDAVGGDPAQLGDLEIMHPHRLRLALGTQFTAVVFEVADQFLLLRVDRDRRLAGGNRRFHRRIDVGELRIPVRVLTTLSRLAVGLATVVQRAQQVGDDTLAGLEPQISERLDKLTLTAADPTQGRTRITPDRVLDQPFQRRRQARLMGDRTLAPGTGAAHAPVNVVAGRLKLVDATIDRTPCDPCRQSGCGDAAKPKGQGFIGRKQASPTLVEKRDDQLPARPDVIKVDHSFRLIPGHRVAPTKLATLLSGFGVVIRGRASSPTVTKIFPYKSWYWPSAVYRYHRSGGKRSVTTPEPEKSHSRFYHCVLKGHLIRLFLRGP